MKVIIVDDEKNAREMLRLMLQKVSSEITVVGEASSKKEAIELLKKSKFDCLFLDIELIDGTGFDILDALPSLQADLVFTTAYNDYAIQAFKENAIDYLLKPIDLTELKLAVEKCGTSVQRFDHEGILNGIKESLYGKRITIKGSNVVEFVNSREILYIQAEGAYATVFLLNGEKVTCTKSLLYFESELDAKGFFRINKSELVNTEMISKYRKDIGNGQVTLKNGDVLPISRRKRAEFNRVLLSK